MNTYFRAMLFGFLAPPSIIVAPGCVLWFRVRITKHLQVIAELPFKERVEAEVAADMRRIERANGLDPERIAYTVANPECFAKAPSHYKGFMGQSIAETFAQQGVWLTPGDDDVINGWQRVQNVLRDSPSGEPWLTIAPSCKVLAEQLETAMSTDQHGDEIMNFAPALQALRLGVMSRPAPDAVQDPQEDPPPYSPAWHMKREREQQENARRFGQIR